MNEATFGVFELAVLLGLFLTDIEPGSCMDRFPGNHKEGTVKEAETAI